VRRLAARRFGQPGFPALLGQHDRRVAEKNNPGRRDRTTEELERGQRRGLRKMFAEHGRSEDNRGDRFDGVAGLISGSDDVGR
jgi:hypothetical protein